MVKRLLIIIFCFYSQFLYSIPPSFERIIEFANGNQEKYHTLVDYDKDTTVTGEEYDIPGDFSFSSHNKKSCKLILWIFKKILTLISSFF